MRPARWYWIALVLSLSLGAGCGGSSEVGEVDESSILESLEAYLPRLAQAYSTGDLEVLRGYAAEKEIAGMEKRIRDLLTERGEIIRPTFRGVELEKAQVWSYSNAFATTLEVWDLEVVASGSETVLSEVEGQRNRVRYQLKRDDDSGRWLVLFREIDTTFD